MNNEYFSTDFPIYGDKIEEMMIVYGVLDCIRRDRKLLSYEDEEFFPARVSISDIISHITSRLSISLTPDDAVVVIYSIIQDYPTLELSFEDTNKIENIKSPENKADWIVIDNSDIHELDSALSGIESLVDAPEFFKLQFVYDGIIEDYENAKIKEEELFAEFLEEQYNKRNQKDQDEDDSVFMDYSEPDDDDDDDIDPLEIRKDAWGNFYTRGGQMWEKAHRREDDDTV